MLEIAKKDNWSKEELEKLDSYYQESENIGEFVNSLDNKTIIKLINEIEKVNGFSILLMELKNYLMELTIELNYFIEEENIGYYDKILELINEFNVNDFGLAYAIGDRYYFNNQKDKALEYYKKIFKEGYDLTNCNYFYSLERYLELLNENPSNILKKLIKASPKDDSFSLDFVNTYLLLIVNLKKFSDEYLEYINEAIKVATPVVREHQKYTRNRTSISDSDEERNLCELICLKFEYYVYKKKYKLAFNQYKKLTKEIGRSDCTRYYHARDKYYRLMLKYMSKDYEELKWFENIGYKEFEIVEEVNNINEFLNKEITLKRKNGRVFKFMVTHIYDNTDVTIAPILPLLGEGGKIFTTYKKGRRKNYLVNKLSNGY